MKTVRVELYRGPNRYIEGVSLEDWDGQLDDAAWVWLTLQGFDGSDPDLWVNIVDADTWAPYNRPIAVYEYAPDQ